MSYHIWPKVVKPLNSPRLELAVKTASEPSDGTVNVYASSLVSIAAIASSEIDLGLPWPLYFSCRLRSAFALEAAAFDDDPRSGTRAWSLSFFRYPRVRFTASTRSLGAPVTPARETEKSELRRRGVVPVVSSLGRGQSPNAKLDRVERPRRTLQTRISSARLLVGE